MREKGEIEIECVCERERERERRERENERERMKEREAGELGQGIYQCINRMHLDFPFSIV